MGIFTALVAKYAFSAATAGVLEATATRITDLASPDSPLLRESAKEGVKRLLECFVSGTTNALSRTLTRIERSSLEVGFTAGLSEVERLARAHVDDREGRMLRDDLLSNESDGTSFEEEVVRASMLKVVEEPERRKWPHVGGFPFARFAFAADISGDSAHSLLHVASRLTHGQLALLALINSRDPRLPARLYPSATFDQCVALADIMHLIREELVVSAADSQGRRGHIFDSTEIVPARIEVLPRGNRLAYLLGLDRISASDLDGALQRLA